VRVELTVALCTYNPRPDLITRAVRAVVAQLADLGGEAQLLIIDNHSDPPLRDADYLRALPLEIIQEPVQGLTAAKEAAIRHARGEVILFVDDDNIVAPGYLREVVKAFADPTLGVLGGSVVPEFESEPPGWLSAFEEQLAIRRYPADLIVETTGLPYTDKFPIGAGSSVRRSLGLAYLADAEATGRIEGRRGRSLSSGEDVDLDLFAISSGYKLKVVGSLSLIHVIPAARTTEEYITRLVISNLRSACEVDRKWRQRFGRPAFEFLHTRRVNIALRCLGLQLLSPLSVTSRVKRAAWEEIRRLQLQT
jgi:glycosyltransferase involved in cell wall biosynthesis